MALYGRYVDIESQRVDKKGKPKRTIHEILSEEEVGKKQYGNVGQMMAMLGKRVKVQPRRTAQGSS